jgi:hypothetical protein
MISFEVPHHLIAQIEQRRLALFQSQYSKMIENLEILELGPNHCVFTDRMLEMKAKKVDLVEMDPQSCSFIRRKYQSENRIQLLEGDLHRILERSEKKYQTIICAGVLYHSPHPLWILERMADLQPEYVLLDTAISQTTQPSVQSEPLNKKGFLHSSSASCGLSIKLPADAILFAMKQLGYIPISNISENFSYDPSGLDQSQIQVLEGWKKGFSYWFKKVSLEPS